MEGGALQRVGVLPKLPVLESRRLRCAPPRPGVSAGSALEGPPAHAGLEREPGRLIHARHPACLGVNR